jgi:hypothetical protein
MAAYKRLQSLPFHSDANNSAKNHQHIPISLSQVTTVTNSVTTVTNSVTTATNSETTATNSETTTQTQIRTSFRKIHHQTFKINMNFERIKTEAFNSIKSF